MTGPKEPWWDSIPLSGAAVVVLEADLKNERDSKSEDDPQKEDNTKEEDNHKK